MEYNNFKNQVGGASIRRAAPLVTNLFTSYDRQLLDAIKPRNVREVDRLLNLGANPNAVSEKTSRTPLYKAVEINNIPIVRRLLQGGANPNLRTNYLSPFQLAFGVYTDRPCNFEIINEMIITGHANVNEDNGLPHALILAINKNCLTTISLLLRSGVDPNIIIRREGRFLRLDRITISREVASILLDNGLNITLYDCFGSRDDLNLKMFRNILIDRLPNVNLILRFNYYERDIENLLLDFAVLTNDIELVNILLRKGADPNMTSVHGSNEGMLDIINYSLSLHRNGGFLLNEEQLELKNTISQILRAAGAINHPINRRRHSYTPDYVTRYIKDDNGFLTLNPVFSNPALDQAPPQALPQQNLSIPHFQPLTRLPDFPIPESPTFENFNALKAKVECPKCHINLKKVILNCNHGFCEPCANSLQNCSICNTPIMKKLTIHKKYLFNNQ